MRVMQLEQVGKPLMLRQRSSAPLRQGQIRIAVSACAVCRTDLHVVDGELSPLECPRVPGHEIVGHVMALADDVKDLKLGQRVGVPWLGWVCGECFYCRHELENLCPNAKFTGYHLDGGFADEAVADSRFVFPLPENYTDVEAAPLLCAGLIGWRTLAAAGRAEHIGIYGFGAAAHIIAQVAHIQGRKIFAFVRPGDDLAESFAKEMGVAWAGPSTSRPPAPLDAALIFAPVGALVPQALQAVRPGGKVVCGGIHMSDIPSFPYAFLWGERSISSIANLTRKDARDFLNFAATHKIDIRTTTYSLPQANDALRDLRTGRFSGAAVITP